MLETKKNGIIPIGKIEKILPLLFFYLFPYKIVNHPCNIYFAALLKPFEAWGGISLADFEVVAVEKEVYACDVEAENAGCFGCELFYFRGHVEFSDCAAS